MLFERLGCYFPLCAERRSFETAEEDDEGMAFEIRLEQGGFPLVQASALPI